MKTVTLKTASVDSLHAAGVAICREAGVKLRWAEVFVAEGNPLLAADYARQTVSLALLALQLEDAAMPYCDAREYVAHKILDELEYQRVSCNRA